jgi:hypothetical protein
VVTVLVAGVGLALAAAERPPRGVLPPPTVVPSATASPLPTPVPVGPVAGNGVSVADDPATHSVVLFGGVDTPDTTWLWDGRRWSSVTPAHSPQARSGAAVAYDPATRLLMLYGGQGDDVGATQFNDTWAWNGVTWARLDSGGTSGPFPGDDGAMAWDAARDEMVLTTSAGSLTNVETWTWNRTRWERDLAGNLAAVAYGATLAYDPESRDVLLVAAAATNFEETSTFDWDGSAWHSLITNGPSLDGVAPDEEANGLVGCGSATYSPSFELQASCWEWGTSTWFQLQAAVPSRSETPMSVAALVDNVDPAQLLVIGWIEAPLRNQAQPLYVWALEGVKWTLLDEP